MNLQDFACRISDIVWGGENGWAGKDGLRKLSDSVLALREREKRLREMLKRVQFDDFDPDEGDYYCSVCGRHDGAGHAPDCELAALLTTSDKSAGDDVAAAELPKKEQE